MTYKSKLRITDAVLYYTLAYAYVVVMTQTRKNPLSLAELDTTGTRFMKEAGAWMLHSVNFGAHLTAGERFIH